jgi:hypothetical protein
MVAATTKGSDGSVDSGTGSRRQWHRPCTEQAISGSVSSVSTAGVGAVAGTPAVTRGSQCKEKVYEAAGEGQRSPGKQ